MTIAMIRRDALVIRTAGTRPPDAQPVEVVERKGLGHPDTLCDAVAERISVRLSRHYLDRFGAILHHNVDKVLLCGGASSVSFGHGGIVEPMDFYLAGRATLDWRGERIPAHEIAIEACKDVLKERLPELDVDRHVRITPRIRSGSAALTGLFDRPGAAPLANDTSCGVGFSPLTELERAVLEIERRLSSSDTRRERPFIGSDIKIMGVRRASRITLTVGCAFVARHVADIADYLRKKSEVAALASEAARTVTNLEVEVEINAADDTDRGDVFLTTIGTSAEAGDDGEVGRGNRTSGLITPYRSMTMEAAAGKNPVSHVGKLYNVLAGNIARAVAKGVAGVTGATCVLVSRIGQPVNDPQVVDLQLNLQDGALVDNVRTAVERIAGEQIEKMPAIRTEILDERILLY